MQCSSREVAVKRKDGILLFFVVAILLFMVWAQSGLRAAGHGALKVTVNYNGTGVVDKQHEIYVLVTDSNPFTSSKLVDASSQPNAPEAGAARILSSQGTATKNGTIAFYNLTVSPVYAVAFFDKNGSYNGRLDSLPPGSPMGIYGKLPDKLEPIKVEEGNGTQIILSFDDSNKTP
jgi:hypothetical protein